MDKFIELAEKYDNYHNYYRGICENLLPYEEENIFFEKFFKPTYNETDKYSHSCVYWMENHDLKEESFLITSEVGL